ncbi:MAG: hypothetical protein H6937_09865 [Burkholderiales bacterium]|uniref:hypothetical protein n=1 Tax=Nitrosomonas sp. TaxID=42353 RepID=UPI001D88D7F7|nr:hypothetical protein [Nitrosomonas sp.]MCB1949738.1 hypothetical protein [Nitrosomonas sp.]MCP5246217.1 hypothetical protein [Burkholderiales bacterium]
MNIEFIYFKECPNANAARENLHKACSALGIEANWQEWDQNNDNVPEHVKDFGSPSILVEGKDVAGGPGECCQAKSCRVYEDDQNAPDVETIMVALRENLHQ